VAGISYDFRLYFEVTEAQFMVSWIKDPEKEDVSLALSSASRGCSVGLWINLYKIHVNEYMQLWTNMKNYEKFIRRE
jgi:hypothetical protein